MMTRPQNILDIGGIWTQLRIGTDETGCKQRAILNLFFPLLYHQYMLLWTALKLYVDMEIKQELPERMHDAWFPSVALVSVTRLA